MVERWSLLVHQADPFSPYPRFLGPRGLLCLEDGQQPLSAHCWWPLLPPPLPFKQGLFPLSFSPMTGPSISLQIREQNRQEVKSAGPQSQLLASVIAEQSRSPVGIASWHWHQGHQAWWFFLGAAPSQPSSAVGSGGNEHPRRAGGKALPSALGSKRGRLPHTPSSRQPDKAGRCEHLSLALPGLSAPAYHSLCWL